MCRAPGAVQAQIFGLSGWDHLFLSDSMPRVGMLQMSQISKHAPLVSLPAVVTLFTCWLFGSPSFSPVQGVQVWPRCEDVSRKHMELDIAGCKGPKRQERFVSQVPCTMSGHFLCPLGRPCGLTRKNVGFLQGAASGSGSVGAAPDVMVAGIDGHTITKRVERDTKGKPIIFGPLYFVTDTCLRNKDKDARP